MGEIDTRFVGDVFVEDFDEGMYRSLSYVIVDGRTFILTSTDPLLAGIDPPLFCEEHGDPAKVGKPMPGIPIIFANPDDSVQRWNIPCFKVRREDPSPALERWPSLYKKFKAPTSDAVPVSVVYSPKLTINGFSKYEEQGGSWPFDIPYTVSCEASGIAARQNAQKMVRFMMRRFPPYAVITVKDSINELRKYQAYVEGPSELSELADIRDRTIVYALSIRVNAEFDLMDRHNVPTVQTKPSLRWHNQEGN